tara:strand:+ start:54 stop:1319 length:1266 start_codon:yes stop_codon:yes gene_type:complete
MAEEKKKPKKFKSNRKLLGETLMYPNALTSIPYASYFKITRWEYKRALEEASNEYGHRDAAALLGRGQGKMLSDGINSTTQMLFDGVNKRMEETLENSGQIQDSFKKAYKPGWFNGRKDNVNAMDTAQKGHDYSQIDFGEDGIKLQDGTTVNSASELEEIRKDAQKHADSLESCYYLPMPNEYSYGYTAGWNNSIKLGAMARVLDSMGDGISQMATTGTAQMGADGLRQLGGQFGKGMKDSSGADFGSMAQEFGKGAVDPFNIGTADTFQPKNLIGLAGLAPNENAIQLFENMSMREFDMSFELMARNQEEAELIDELINNFKTGMHPYANKSGTGGVLGFPDVFVIEPQFNFYDEGSLKPGAHPQMPKTKLCALTKMSVNTTPANQFTTTTTGQLPLQTMRMNFSETTALTQMDFESGVY